MDKAVIIGKLQQRKRDLDSERETIASSLVLLVGAGGIGCEVLKNLVLSGFSKIHLFDLDTIEVSNLNRQFLFQKQHVGMPKCIVAKESALAFNPNCDIVTYHDSIINEKYNVSFLKQFAIVINALDNRAARNHVNRLCLAADVALIESGSAGFYGQTYVIKKGLSECYECIAKPPKEKTYPTCTVRNTPSEPIHCIVWAKQLFHQLFGEVDPDDDNEVSPNSNDLEAQENLDTADAEALKDYDQENKVSTRDWAVSVDYDPSEILNKLFVKDVQYLLTMKNLWLKRTPPRPLALPESMELTVSPYLVDNESWDIETWIRVLGKSIVDLKNRKNSSNGFLTWDKDDDLVMDFTASAANIRCHVFNIVGKSRFDVKSMAGNIIPAIATTNAIVAGLMVTEVKKAIMGKFDQCRLMFLRRQPVGRLGSLFMASKLHPPNPACYVCSSKPEIVLKVNCKTFQIKSLVDKVLKKTLSMVEPDVEIDDGKGTILVSSDAEDNIGNLDRTLESFKVADASRLKADDFFQNFTIVIVVQHCEKVSQEERSLTDDQNFEVLGLDSIPPPKESENDTVVDASKSDIPQSANGQLEKNSEKNGVQSSNGAIVNLDDSDDDETRSKISEPESKKLKLDVGEVESAEELQKKTQVATANESDDLVCLD